MDPVDEIFDETEKHMKKSIEMAETELSTIRTGKATPALLDTIKVDYYGAMVPLKQVAQIAVPDPKLIRVQPWEKPLIGEIMKVIQASDLGLNAPIPQRSDDLLRALPALLCLLLVP